MTRTIEGRFLRQEAVDRAHAALEAAGFRTLCPDDAAHERGSLRVVVEVDARAADARDLLLRTGAFRVDGRPVDAAAAHGPEHGEEQHPHGGAWLREIVFGLNDGLVTTLVFIMAASEVAQTHAALLLVALSEIAAGGVSMALGGYLAARTERDLLAHRIATERHEIEHEPEEERAELRDIYRRKGMTGRLLERVVAHQTAEHDRWLNAMVHDELGVVDEQKVSPLRQGLQIGASFVLGGLIPTIPVFLALAGPWLQVVAYVLTALTALALGAVKARYSLKGPLRNGLEFLAIVTLGTLAGVAIGLALHAV